MGVLPCRRRLARLLLTGLPAAVALAGVRPAFAQQSAPELLTLDQVLAAALQNNRSLQIAGMDVERARQLTAAARTRRLPALDVDFTAARLLQPIEFGFSKGSLGRLPGAGPIPNKDVTIRTDTDLSTSLTARLSQPLTGLRKIGLQIRSSRAGEEIAKEEVRRQRQTLADEVRQVYYRILQTQSGLEANEAALKSAQELERVVNQLVEEREALPGDLLDVRTRLAKTQSDHVGLTRELTDARERLNYLMGRDLRTGFTVADPNREFSTQDDLSRLQERALRRRPELRQSALRISQAKYDRDGKRTELTPQVALTAGFINSFNVDVLAQGISTVGLQFTWEPWDWGRKRHELAEKKKAVEQAQVRLKDAEAQILLEVSSQFRQLGEAAERVKVTRANQEASHEKVRVALNRYREKASLLSEVLEAQAVEADALRQNQQALLALSAAGSGLSRAIGEE